MKDMYHVVVSGNNEVYNCNAKSLKSAKSKITKFVNNYPYKITDAVVYLNSKVVYERT